MSKTYYRTDQSINFTIELYHIPSLVLSLLTIVIILIGPNNFYNMVFGSWSLNSQSKLSEPISKQNRKPRNSDNHGKVYLIYYYYYYCYWLTQLLH